LNPVGLITEAIDNVVQKIPTVDFEAYVDKKTGERVAALTPEKVAEYKAAQAKHALEIGGIQKKYGISKLEATEEWIADGFADYVAGKKTFTGKVASYFQYIFVKYFVVFPIFPPSNFCS